MPTGLWQAMGVNTKTLFRSVASTCFAAVFSAGLAFPAAAATPPEILEPYRAYIKATKAGDAKTALKFARKAYEASEGAELKPSLRASLAHNLAMSLGPEDAKESVSLLREAIALDVDNPGINAERHVKIGTLYLYNPEFAGDNVKLMQRHIGEGVGYMEATGQVESTFGAEMLALRGASLAVTGKNDRSLEDVERALAIFDSDAHTYASAQRYQAYLIKGEILNQADRPIDAALALQVVMQNLEDEVPADHPFIDSAFSQWMRARGMIEVDGLTDAALEAGVCKCWPYDERSTAMPLPLVRIPPQMPSRARRSGHVMVRFDVDATGSPVNVVPVAATDRLYVKPSVKSVEKWKYELNDEIADEDRKGFMSKVTFRLVNERGQVIPEPDGLIILDEAGYAASKAAAEASD